MLAPSSLCHPQPQHPQQHPPVTPAGFDDTDEVGPSLVATVVPHSHLYVHGTHDYPLQALGLALDGPTRATYDGRLQCACVN